MTTRLEIEHTVWDKGRETKSREPVLELDDRTGVQKTEFGNVGVDVKTVQVNHMCLEYIGFFEVDYYRVSSNNTDIIIDASKAPELAERLKAPKRRISVGTDGDGAQQIGKDVTLFVHSDLFRREKR